MAKYELKLTKENNPKDEYERATKALIISECHLLITSDKDLKSVYFNGNKTDLINMMQFLFSLDDKFEDAALKALDIEIIDDAMDA